MTKWKYIQHLLKLIFTKRKKWELQTGHIVDVAFYSGGKPYYKLHDMFDTFTERGLDAYQVYEEISMRIEVTTLKEFVKEFKKLCNSNPIQILEVSRVLNFLEERVNFVIPPKNLIYKMAAVAYFDENESPYTYKETYSQKKIATWKKNGDVDDFFLYQQLDSLIPLPKLSKEIYQTCQTTLEKILKYQSKATSGKQSATREEVSSLNGTK